MYSQFMMHGQKKHQDTNKVRSVESDAHFTHSSWYSTVYEVTEYHVMGTALLG